MDFQEHSVTPESKKYGFKKCSAPGMQVGLTWKK